MGEDKKQKEEKAKKAAASKGGGAAAAKKKDADEKKKTGGGGEEKQKVKKAAAATAAADKAEEEKKGNGERKSPSTPIAAEVKKESASIEKANETPDGGEAKKAPAAESPTNQKESPTTETGGGEGGQQPGKEAGEPNNASGVDEGPVPKIRLTYFDGAGRAELSRLILAAAGLDYEDRRIDNEQWMRMKEGAYLKG